jgi:L-lactate dehydrogenase complex protein LldG
MSGTREDFLDRVRAALAPLPERAPLPQWHAELAVARSLMAHRDPLELFVERIKLVHGLALLDPVALVAHLRAGKHLRGYCDPALLPALREHFGPDFVLETEFDRSRVDDYAFGITCAAGAIAETGTIILNDATTSRRLGALAPWIHVAVLKRAQIHPTVVDAVATLGDDPNIIWATGPSKTADIEGILIEGVHGPGEQIALIIG